MARAVDTCSFCLRANPAVKKVATDDVAICTECLARALETAEEAASPVGPFTLRPTDGVEIDVSITLRGELAETLVKEANKRNVQPINLLSRIVENVLSDDLVGAVVDDDEDEVASPVFA